jgi:hypothetical protein
MFANGGAVWTHVRYAHPRFDAAAQQADVEVNAGPRAKRVRSSYSLQQKLRCVRRYTELEAAGHPTPAKQVTIEIFGAVNYQRRKGYVTKWLRQVENFRRAIKECKAGRKRLPGGGRKVRFPQEEDELYVRLLVRRQAYGYPCDHFWLQHEFRNILNESKPEGYDTCKFSWGWAVNFCVRYRLSTQASNNIKAHDQVDRAPEIRRFHRYWLETVQKSEPQTDEKYGRFPPSHIFHVDQVPLCYASPHTRTLNPIGAPSCRIAGPNTAGLEKRQGTLQMWMCADKENQVVKSSLIFRGSRGEKSRLPKPAEKAVYAQLKWLRVHFQSKAWADEIFCEEDILNVAKDLQQNGIEGQVVMGMDNHKCQCTGRMRELYTQLGMVPLFTPPDCTDCVSPVDHHCGRFVQEHMAKKYRAALEERRALWMASENDEEDIADPESTSAMMRRIEMAKWADDALELLFTQERHRVHQAFFNTGFLLAKDGSEDARMRLQGWSGSEPYRFR